MTEYAFPAQHDTGMMQAQYGAAGVGYAVPVSAHSPGMTLRDYFAAQALAGLLAKGTYSYADIHAKRAYEHADEMLKVREAK